MRKAGNKRGVSLWRAPRIPVQVEGEQVTSSRRQAWHGSGTRRLPCGTVRDPDTAGMDANIQSETARLAGALEDASEELDLAADEDSTAEEVEEARALATEVLSRYASLLSRLDMDDKTEVQRSIGLKVVKIEALLTKFTVG